MVDNHFLHSRDLNVLFRGDSLKRNEMAVSPRGKRVKIRPMVTSKSVDRVFHFSCSQTNMLSYAYVEFPFFAIMLLNVALNACKINYWGRQRRIFHEFVKFSSIEVLILTFE